MPKIKQRVLFDHFKSGTSDLVTDRVKSKWLGILATLIFPVVVTNLSNAYFIRHLPDQWSFPNATSVVILNEPQSMVLGTPLGVPWELICTNKASIPVPGLKVSVDVVAVEPDSEYAFCNGLIEGTFDHERLSTVCAPVLAEHELFTNSSGMVDFAGLIAVGGVPGLWDLHLQVFHETRTRSTGADVLLYTPTAEARVVVRMHRNLGVALEPVRPPPRELEFGQVLDGADWACGTPADYGIANCSEGARDDLLPPAVRLVFSGGAALASNHTRVVLFAVADFAEARMPNASIARSRNPQRAVSVRKFARISNGTSTALAASVDSGTAEAAFSGVRVVAGNNPALFLAFYSCGQFVLWNEHYIDPSGALIAVEIALNPPLQAGRLRAAEGTVWMPSALNMPLDLDSDGTPRGDQTYLTELEIRENSYPTEVREGEAFVVELNAFTFRYPRSRQLPLFPAGTIVVAEAVPDFAVPGASSLADFWRNAKRLTGAVSAPSPEGGVGITFADLRFTTEGATGPYKIRFYAEGFYHVTTSQAITVRGSLNLLRVLLPPSLQLLYPRCNLSYVPTNDRNQDGNPDYPYATGAVQRTCLPVQAFTTYTPSELPYVEAYTCADSIFELSSECVPVEGKELTVTLTAQDRVALNYREGVDEGSEQYIRWPELEETFATEAVEFTTRPLHRGRFELSSLTIPHLFAKHWVMSFSVGGRVSPVTVAVEVQNASLVKSAIEMCGYTPIATISILDQPTGPVTPGASTFFRALAIDIMGEPAADRTLCLRFFPLEGPDYLDKLTADYIQVRAVSSERIEMNNYATRDNYTFYDPTCFITARTGIGEINFEWTAPEVVGRRGPHAWYVESHEYTSGTIYRKLVSRYIGQEYDGNARAGECLREFGVAPRLARTGAKLVDILPVWSGEQTPTALLPFSSFPVFVDSIGAPIYGERASWYGGAQRRTVSVDTRHRFYLRLYQGAALLDSVPTDRNDLFPWGHYVTLILASAPEGFPGQRAGEVWPHVTPPERCASWQPTGTGECWTQSDLVMTAVPESLGTQAVTDDNGIASFQFRSTRPGIYRILLQVGTRTLYNELAYLVEIEVVRFRQSPHCLPSALNVASLAPSIKNYDRCPYRQQDGSCPWYLNQFCERGGVRNAAILSQPPPSECVPLGAPFPGSFEVAVLSDAGEPLADFYATLEGNERVVHASLGNIGPTPAAGSEAVTPVLNYADLGENRVQWRVKGIDNPYSAVSEPSEPFVVSDYLVARFAVEPPSVLVVGNAPVTPVTVDVTVVRRCQVPMRVDRWVPPPLEIFLEELPAPNATAEDPTPFRAEALANLAVGLAGRHADVVLEGAVSQPSVVTPGREARASWPDFRLAEGLAGTYVVGVRVVGSTVPLIRSSPIFAQAAPSFLMLLEEVPSVINFELTLSLRVLALSASRQPVSNAVLVADIAPSDPAAARDAGLIATSLYNVSAAFDTSTNRMRTGEDGVAHFRLRLARFTQTNITKYVVSFSGRTRTAASVLTTPFHIISTAATVEMISQPRVWDTVGPQWVWPLLRTKHTPIGLMTYLKPAWVQETPASMKGTFLGQGENSGETDIVLRVKDYTGRGIEGLKFNVTLVDVDGNILDEVTTASRGVPLSQDWGLESRFTGADFCRTDVGTLDCHGLYHFPILATNNRVVDGFYQFRFEVNGIEVVQTDELLFDNIYFPDTKFKEAYLLGAGCTMFIIYFIFRRNRLRRLRLNVQTGKFVQEVDKHAKPKMFVMAAVVAGFAALHWLFYDVSDLDKVPPIEIDGRLTFADGFGRWSTILLLAAVLILALTAKEDEDETMQAHKEQTVRRLGVAESVEVIRRNYVPRPPKYIHAPPDVDAKNWIVRAIKKRVAKFQKHSEFVGKLWPILKFKANALYLRARNGVPMFRNIYTGVTDIFFPHRLLFTLGLAAFTSVKLCGIGLWLSDNARGILSQQYAAYVRILAEHRGQQVDWVQTARVSSAGRLLNVNEYIILFCARTAPLGTPFYYQMSEAVVGSLQLSAYATTLFFVLGTAISLLTTREHISLMRRGQHAARVNRIKLGDASAYLGTQALTAAVGWLVMFLLFFMFLFVYWWPPMRVGYDDLMRATWASTLPLYFFAVLFARLAVYWYPGIMVANRPLWALNEFVLLMCNIFVGGPIAFGRTCVGILRTVLLWSWLQNAQHPNDPLGTPGSGLYYASMYVDHLHNSPLPRVIAQRLHVELRNMANLRRFPPDNIEPIILKQELQEDKDARVKRRVLARLMVLFLLRTNAERGLSEFRKGNIQPDILQVAPEENEQPEGTAVAKWKQMEREQKQKGLQRGESVMKRYGSVRAQPTLRTNAR